MELFGTEIIENTDSTEKMENKNIAFFPDCRLTEAYNPYNAVVHLHEDNGTLKPYLCVNERIVWFHRYCEDAKIHGSITTEFVPELTRAGMITMKATVSLGEGGEVFTGYGSRLVNSAEGYSGDDIEGAETRAIGRALRNAGFGSPFYEGDEGTPVDGAMPQNIPSTYNMSAADVLDAVTDDIPMEATNPAPATQATATAATETTTTKKQKKNNLSLDAKLAGALKMNYPFKPWPQIPVYELLDNPQLKEHLTWLANQYNGKEEIKNWATFVLKYVFFENETDKQIYIAARKILRDEGLIK